MLGRPKAAQPISEMALMSGWRRLRRSGPTGVVVTDATLACVRHCSIVVRRLVRLRTNAGGRPMSYSNRSRVATGFAAALLCTLAAAVHPGAATAAITVSNTNDSGPGSLRQAIADAAPAESIVVPAGIYTLTTGELRIANSLTIAGSGAAGTIIQAGDQSRVFHTSGPASDITIAGVTISGGETRPAPGAQLAQGGGVLNNDATLTLADDVIKDSIADADGDGGSGAGSTAEGGGVYSARPGTLHLLDMKILSNSASAVGSSGHGGGDADGGGAKILGAFTIAGTTFEDNRADARGGQGPSNAGQSGGFSVGGGLEAEPPGAGSQLSSSTLDANVADASPGPGGADGLAVGAGTFLESDNGPLKAADVTITGNVARASGGNADGGGIYFAGSGQVLTLTNSTLSANSTTGAVSNQGGNVYDDNGTIAMQNTIVSAGVADPGSENCASPAVSLDHNLDSHDQCGFHAAGDLINKDPVSRPLENNGGPVQTMALQPGSPAIDAGGASACPAIDARGVLRPAGASCDIGAFELATPAATTGQASMIATGSAVISGVASNPDLAGASAVFQYGTTTAYSESTPGQPVSPTTAAAQLTAPLAGLAPATTYHFRIVVKNAAGSVTGTDHTFTTRQPAPAPGSLPQTPAPPKIAKLKITPAALSLNQSATVSYTDTEAARTAFTLQRAMPGRLDGRACSTATRHNRRDRHCARWVNAGATFTHADTPGSNHFLFTARQITRNLALGHYRLQATPRAHGLVGRTLTAKLRIKAPSRQRPAQVDVPHRTPHAPPRPARR
jgi:hypothetical protein